MVGGLFLLSKPCPYPKGAGPQRSPILEVPSIYAIAYTLCRRTTKRDVVTHLRWGQPRLPSKESRVPALPRIWGFSIRIYAHALWRRTTKFGMVTHMGRDVFEEVNRAIACAQNAVCQRHLSFLLLILGIRHLCLGNLTTVLTATQHIQITTNCNIEGMTEEELTRCLSNTDDCCPEFRESF